MNEHTLVLIKPDAVQRALVGEIISRFERCGLKIVGMKMVLPSESQAKLHYADDDEWKFSVGAKQKKSYAAKGKVVDKTEVELGSVVRNQLIDFLTMSPIIALSIQGHNCVAHVRKIVGETSPQDSAPGTIRGDYSFDTYQLADVSKRPLQNLIHASSDTDEAKRELDIWFTQDEIHDWKRIDEELLYRRIE